ncbi:MAG TPA: hypothetical protein VGX50_04005 [Longimicrobium sp.]|jgi:hypothetical protein|nr:hypothetical protein [Longimicrobium sp.]
MIIDEFNYSRTPPLSLEGSREVLDEIANPPEDTPGRRRTLDRVPIMTAGAVRLQVTDEGVVIPREMLPNVKEVDLRKEGGVMVLTLLPDPDDPLWELGNDPVVCGLPDASENHDRYIYTIDS